LKVIAKNSTPRFVKHSVHTVTNEDDLLRKRNIKSLTTARPTSSVRLSEYYLHDLNIQYSNNSDNLDVTS